MAKILPKYHLQKSQYSPLTMTSPYTVTHCSTNLQPIRWLLAAILMAIFTGCAKESDADDGMGRFETDEATVIAMSSGELQQFGVAEGQQLQKGMIVGLIENTELLAQREELRSTLAEMENNQQMAISQGEMARRRLADLQKQATSLRQQIAEVQGEKVHYEELYEKGVVARNQVEAFDTRLDMLEKQLMQIEEQIGNTVVTDEGNHGMLPDDAAQRSAELQTQLTQLDQQLTGIQVTVPITGTVVEKKVGEGDYVTAGTALFKMADLSRMTLRAYLSSESAARLKIGQKVKVAAETGLATPREYDGIVTWISQQAEFGSKPSKDNSQGATPQATDDGLHAVKVEVMNDGQIDIGMRGRIVFED